MEIGECFRPHRFITSADEILQGEESSHGKEIIGVSSFGCVDDHRTSRGTFGLLLRNSITTRQGETDSICSFADSWKNLSLQP
jgi:hypothetical protein